MKPLRWYLCFLVSGVVFDGLGEMGTREERSVRRLVMRLRGCIGTLFCGCIRRRGPMSRLDDSLSDEYSLR